MKSPTSIRVITPERLFNVDDDAEDVSIAASVSMETSTESPLSNSAVE